MADLAKRAAILESRFSTEGGFNVMVVFNAPFDQRRIAPELNPVLTLNNALALEFCKVEALEAGFFRELYALGHFVTR